MGYKNDRTYTNAIHDNIAVNTIYPAMQWQLTSVNHELSEMQDSEYAIDYHAIDINNVHIVIQERFRRQSNANFNDFTIRYERPNNEEEVEQKSEFFKMKAKIKRFSEPFYMIYGILNASLDGFDKWVVIYLRAFFRHYANKKIKIDFTKKFSQIQDNTLICGWNQNNDDSSSFICINIPQIMQLFDDVVVYQEGFVPKRTGGATEKQIKKLQIMASKNGFQL